MRNWLMAHWRWIGGIVAVSVVGVAGIQLFVFGGFGITPAFERSIEESWVDTIEKLGIEPRFPPEEDFVVGDLLAIVTKDENVDPDTKITVDPYAKVTIADARTASFLRRAVKLAHVDMNSALNEEYERLPSFPDLVPAAPLTEGASGGPVAKPPAPKLTRDFVHGVRLKDLPLAAFPRLKIQGTSMASAGLAGTGIFGSFGASNKEIEELELGEVRTYGLPTIKATRLLEAYCKNNKDDCTEETARYHLRALTANRSREKNVINAQGDERYTMSVEVVMVYRIYVTRSIKNLRQASRAQQGGIGAAATPSPSAKPADDTPTGNAESDAMKRRITELERQFTAVKNANAAVAEAAYNRESSFQDTFDRPVAIGFRGIRVDWTRTDKGPTEQNAKALQ